MYVTHWEGICCAWRVQTSTESRGQINLATLLFTKCNFDLLFHLFDYIFLVNYGVKRELVQGLLLVSGKSSLLLYSILFTQNLWTILCVSSCPKIWINFTLTVSRLWALGAKCWANLKPSPSPSWRIIPFRIPWLITIVIVSPLAGLIPLPNGPNGL